jgi:hypothetical protein
MSSTPWSSSRTDADPDRWAGAEPRRASRLAVVGAAFVLLVLVVAGSVGLGALIEGSVALFVPR